jgi:hypothetical protein
MSGDRETLDPRTTDWPGCSLSHRVSKLVNEIFFGWIITL